MWVKEKVKSERGKKSHSVFQDGDNQTNIELISIMGNMSFGEKKEWNNKDFFFFERKSININKWLLG